MSIQHYLETLFQQIKKETCLSSLNKQYLKNTETQGEILYESLNEILNHLNLQETDCFIDLGSGLGKTVLQVFLTTSAKLAIGIEILPHLHQSAKIALQETRKRSTSFFQHDRELIFINKNFLNLSFPDATVVFLNATCFSQPLLFNISQLIKNFPKLHTILSTRPLYFINKPFILTKTFSIECSWDSAICYCYLKK